MIGVTGKGGKGVERNSTQVVKTENSLVHIYKEECLFVDLSICLFFMRLVPVRASVTIISTAYSQDHRKVKAGSARPGRLG
jgi:hypothetical protein